MCSKHHKKKRQQPRPKIKKSRVGAKQSILWTKIESKLRPMGKQLIKLVKDKEHLQSKINELICEVEGYFRKYDTIQLLGGIGLYLIDNLPNIEKYFIAQMSGSKLRLDEDAEVIAEYALNFGLSMPNDSREVPTDKIIRGLREKLRTLSKIYGLIDIPTVDNASQWVDWIIHSETIFVRGDGYQTHIQEVFKEMFSPHSPFYQQKYGYTIDDLAQFFQELEDRIVCKIGSENQIYGIYKMWERWKCWEEETYGTPDDENYILRKDCSKGPFGDFFEANPDVLHTEDGQFCICSPDDFSSSDTIFWILPQNEKEEKIMKSLSVEFGSNDSFIAEGEYKGNIMNGHSIYEKPFVKDGGKYYCFTPMIPHRNLFLIAEKLMMRDPAYYNSYFQQNKQPISRDRYIENKVLSVLKSFLPNVVFSSSVNYQFTDEKGTRETELDILGVSEKATYLIEVKGHELSHKDRVGLTGAKFKFKESVYNGCYQCNRAKMHILNDNLAEFSGISVDRHRPIYKINVTFHHYSTLLGNIDKLIDADLMEEEYRDTWIVSLFDLMVVADFINSEDEFINYLEMHKEIYRKHCIFNDEIDLLAGFLNDNLAEKVKRGKNLMIFGGSDQIDEEYAKDYQLPINAMPLNS